MAGEPLVARPEKFESMFENMLALRGGLGKIKRTRPRTGYVHNLRKEFAMSLQDIATLVLILASASAIVNNVVSAVDKVRDWLTRGEDEG